MALISGGHSRRMERFINNPVYPEWLKQAGLNELYYNTFGSLWENGCISKPKKSGNRPGQHLEFVMESLEYRDAEALDVRHHYCRTNRDLWPGIERAILLLFADASWTRRTAARRIT